jgi:DNA polymerase III subunit gamma/tau
MMSPPRGPSNAPSMSGSMQAVALATDHLATYISFDQIVALIREKRDVQLLVEVETTLRLARFSPGRIEFQPTSNAAPDFASRLSGRLASWTGARWAVSVVSEGGAPTIAEVRDKDRIATEDEAATIPLVQAVLAAFPGAKIIEIRTPQAMAALAAIDALPEADDDFDPFEDD